MWLQFERKWTDKMSH